MTESAAPLVPQADVQPWVQPLPRRVARRIGWAIRDAWPGRPVRREVQGVSMMLPWVHRLPDYTAAPGSVYGQNLVRLAVLLHTPEAPLHLLDVGANVGDSALQVLAVTPGARVLCVEPDDFYLPFLRRNTAAGPVVVVPALLLTEAAEPGAAAMSPVRRWGTTTFAAADAPGQTATVTVDELVARHPDFASIRLVKSDTDGYDVQLVPALARAYAANRPVLFFEYDLRQTRAAGLDPVPVWTSSRRWGTPRSRSGATAASRWRGSPSPRCAPPSRSSTPARPSGRRRTAADGVLGRRGRARRRRARPRGDPGARAVPPRVMGRRRVRSVGRSPLTGHRSGHGTTELR